MPTADQARVKEFERESMELRRECDLARIRVFRPGGVKGHACGFSECG